MTGVKLLIVEDEPVIALDIKRRLIRLGYEVVAIADSSETALEAMAQFSPDLILMDIQLQGDIDGIQTAAQVRERFNLPVVFLTAHADEATLKQAKLTQPFGYIVKPFESSDLSTAIEIAISRHQTERAIQLALAREKELNELKSRFVSIVSHEFRNPLSSIQIALDLLETQGSHITPEKRHLYFQRAKGCIQQMKELLEDVLVIGESEAGKLTCQPTELDIDTFCRNLVEEFQISTGGQHTLMFTTEHRPGADDRPYYLDEKLLRYILANLLSNAIKYSPSNSTVRFELVCEPDTLTFRVQDQGIGIPQADQVNLFNPFHRAMNASKFPGTGLGLSIVKQCVDLHNGQISVESEVGMGTIFTVVINRHS